MLGFDWISAVTAAFGVYVGNDAACIPASTYLVAYNLEPSKPYASTIALDIDNISSSLKFNLTVSATYEPSEFTGILACAFDTTMKSCPPGVINLTST